LFNRLKTRFEKFDLNWRRSLEPWEGREEQLISAAKHAFWIDHEFLRYCYHNRAQVAPGVFRANQPSPERIINWAKLGIKTIVNLRGRSNHGSYFLETQKCRDLGINLINHPLYATRLANQDELLSLEQIFRSIEYPILLHCKSGADRAGLASVLYHLMILGTPFSIARKHLSFRYLHIKYARSGILDFMLDSYECDMQKTGVGFKSWLQTSYDPQELTQRYRG
jgi:protein tyrosine/serine phosphatase